MKGKVAPKSWDSFSPSTSCLFGHLALTGMAERGLRKARYQDGNEYHGTGGLSEGLASIGGSWLPEKWTGWEPRNQKPDL